MFQIELTDEKAEQVSKALINIKNTLDYLTACSGGNGNKARKQAFEIERLFNRKYLKEDEKMRIKEPTRQMLRTLFKSDTDFLIAEKEAVDRLRSEKDAGKRERIPFVANKFVSKTEKITVVFLSVFDFED